MTEYKPSDFPSWIQGDDHTDQTAALLEMLAAFHADPNYAVITIDQPMTISGGQLDGFYGRYVGRGGMQLQRDGYLFQMINGGKFYVDHLPVKGQTHPFYSVIAVGVQTPNIILDLAQVPQVRDITLRNINVDWSRCPIADLQIVPAGTSVSAGLLISKGVQVTVDGLAISGGILANGTGLDSHSGVTQSHFYNLNISGRAGTHTQTTCVWFDGATNSELRGATLANASNGVSVAFNADNNHPADGIILSNVVTDPASIIYGMALNGGAIKVEACQIRAYRTALSLLGTTASNLNDLSLMNSIFSTAIPNFTPTIDFLNSAPRTVRNLIMAGCTIQGSDGWRLTNALYESVIQYRQDQMLSAKPFVVGAGMTPIATDPASLSAAGLEPTVSVIALPGT